MALTQDQIRILAQTLMGEARGEGYEGMRAVAHVIRNRANSGRFPSDPVSVALQPYQFSTWNSGEGGNNPGRFGPGTPGYEDAVRAVEAVFNGNDPDPTGGATHYWAPRGMPGGRDPYWAASETTQYGRLPIGNHIFLPQAPVGQSNGLNAIAQVAPTGGGASGAMGYAPTGQQPPGLPPARPDWLLPTVAEQAPSPIPRPANLGPVPPVPVPRPEGLGMQAQAPIPVPRPDGLGLDPTDRAMDELRTALQTGQQADMSGFGGLFPPTPIPRPDGLAVAQNAPFPIPRPSGLGPQAPTPLPRPAGLGQVSGASTPPNPLEVIGNALRGAASNIGQNVVSLFTTNPIERWQGTYNPTTGRQERNLPGILGLLDRGGPRPTMYSPDPQETWSTPVVAVGNNTRRAGYLSSPDNYSGRAAGGRDQDEVNVYRANRDMVKAVLGEDARLTASNLEEAIRRGGTAYKRA